MGLRVNTNTASLNAQRNLAGATNRIGGSFRKLSTGLRISTAADDAAGLAISERLRAQVRSLDQAKRNANDGISLVQTSEGALNEISSVLVRLRELAVQANNGTASTNDQQAMNEEFQQLVGEVDRIGRAAEFSGIKLLDGSQGIISFQVGFGTTSSVDTLDVRLSPALSTSLALENLTLMPSDGSSGPANAAMNTIDSAIDAVSSLRGSLGSIQNRLQSTISTLATAGENLSAAESRIRDVDVAFETAQLTRNNILQQASLSVLSQANAQPESALRLIG